MKITFREQPSTGKCALCGAPMVERTVKRGRNTGSTFLGCSRFPQCAHIIDGREDGLPYLGVEALDGDVDDNDDWGFSRWRDWGDL